jgi:hypothetical protein
MDPRPPKKSSPTPQGRHMRQSGGRQGRRTRAKQIGFDWIDHRPFQRINAIDLGEEVSDINAFG